MSDIQLFFESSDKLYKGDFKSSQYLLIRGSKTECTIPSQCINIILLYSNVDLTMTIIIAFINSMPTSYSHCDLIKFVRLFPFQESPKSTRSVIFFQSNCVRPLGTLMSSGRYLYLFILRNPWWDVFTPCFLSGEVILFQFKFISPLSYVIIIAIPVE